ncbi:hypothetical protein LMA04_06230 [Pseudescherichia vulneris]|uniref:FGGY family carbohydrate kinase n=1 Tax=Pseudescherichia vulneris TaxID=566 RepID=UPI00227B8A18|nr:FGGY-family carbohydrate kinase [Pseudescherichia vulneris]WAH53633.1 hypothetical protein LMA04_06230 [Pseudescherichia vulneris]
MSSHKNIIIALDEGTTNAKAVALDAAGKVIVKFNQPLSIQTPREGWVEQSGTALVEASVKVIAQAIDAVGAENVVALAISNQRETAIGWYRSNGMPLHAAISWQCSRTADFCDALRRDNKEQTIKAVTGLPIAPLFSGSKMRWLIESTPNGQALGEAGCVKATYGTGSSVMAPVTSAQCNIHALATTLAWHDGEQLIYGLEGNIPHTGDGVAWMADSTGLSELPETELAAELNSLPASVESTLGVYFVPALTGLGAPWWDENARGVICGLSRGVKRAHLIRAALEAITYQIADVVTAMRQHNDFTLTALMVDGGPTKNDWLMQYQSDLLGCPVMRSDVPELSAIGAALLARKAVGQLSLDELKQYLYPHSEFRPNMERHGRLQKRWREWQQAVERTLHKF